jgi:type IV secretory pathway VirB10-like protein
MVIDNLPATDTAGYAGLSDSIDLRTWKLLKGIGLATVLGVGSSLAFGSGSGDSDIVRALRESVTNCCCYGLGLGGTGVLSGIAILVRSYSPFRAEKVTLGRFPRRS